MSTHDDVDRRWQEAEGRLYPVINLRPDLYERSVGVVRALADHLGDVPDLVALRDGFRASSAVEDLMAAGVDVIALPKEIDPDLVRGAAYQIRSRELAQQSARDDARRRIAEARSAGQGSCTVWSYGDDPAVPPYRRVEMSLATGFAVVSSSELDPDTMGPLYVLDAVQLDPETGENEGDDPLVARREFTDPTTWRAATEELQTKMLIT